MSLESVLAGQGRSSRQFDGPQEGTVLRVVGARCYVALGAFPGVEHACRFSRPAGPHLHPNGNANTIGDPPKGTPCLVLFAGSGVGSPWVVAFDGWPA
jgi:hypothetical protein